MSAKQKKRGLSGLFILIALDIISLGMIIPLIPIMAREFGADGLKVGLIISAYSMIQFLLAPYWGRLSDIFGRKPVLLTGLFGSGLAHLLFAFADTFADIFFSRALAGFFGANVVTASAYIADRTSLNNRSKNMGLIGLAFGLGFTVGPLIGFFLILWGDKLGSIPPYGANFAAMGAFILCLANGLASSLFLKESLASHKKALFAERVKSSLKTLFLFSKRPSLKPLPAKESASLPERKTQKEEKAFPSQKPSLFARPSPVMIWQALKTPKLGIALVMSFILWFCLAQIEPVLILTIQDDFDFNKKTAYGAFIYIGILMMFSQGFLVRKWIPKWGERAVNQKALLALSIGLMTLGLSVWMARLAFLPLALLILTLGVSLFSIGYSLSNTSLKGALSLLSPDTKQGGIFGVNQSLSAIARIAGPAMGGWLYRDLSHESPFLAGGALTLIAFLIAVRFKEAVPVAGLNKPKK